MKKNNTINNLRERLKDVHYWIARIFAHLLEMLPIVLIFANLTCLGYSFLGCESVQIGADSATFDIHLNSAFTFTCSVFFVTKETISNCLHNWKNRIDLSKMMYAAQAYRAKKQTHVNPILYSILRGHKVEPTTPQKDSKDKRYFSAVDRTDFPRIRYMFFYAISESNNILTFYCSVYFALNFVLRLQHLQNPLLLSANFATCIAIFLLSVALYLRLSCNSTPHS